MQFISEQYASSEDGESFNDEPSSRQPVKIRTLPHLPGNWPTHVYIDVNVAECKQPLMERLNAIKTIPLKYILTDQSPTLRQSLSRPMYLKLFQIDPFINQLRTELEPFRRFVCRLASFQWLTNDEKTRSFLCWCVDLGVERLKMLTRAVDNCCRAFNQPIYHQNPIFHLSIAWTDLINTKQLPSIDCSESIYMLFEVKTVRISCGNKDFSIDLTL